MDTLGPFAIVWSATGEVNPQFLSIAEDLFWWLVFSLIWTLFGILAMTWLAPGLPPLRLGLIFFWAIFRVMLIPVILRILGVLFQIDVEEYLTVSNETGFAIIVLAVCLMGWLITRDMAKYYDMPRRFPAIGAKVMATSIFFFFIAVAMYFLFI